MKSILSCLILTQLSVISFAQAEESHGIGFVLKNIIERMSSEDFSSGLTCTSLFPRADAKYSIYMSGSNRLEVFENLSQGGEKCRRPKQAEIQKFPACLRDKVARLKSYAALQTKDEVAPEFLMQVSVAKSNRGGLSGAISNLLHPDPKKCSYSVDLYVNLEGKKVLLADDADIPYLETTATPTAKIASSVNRPTYQAAPRVTIPRGGQ